MKFMMYSFIDVMYDGIYYDTSVTWYIIDSY